MYIHFEFGIGPHITPHDRKRLARSHIASLLRNHN